MKRQKIGMIFIFMLALCSGILASVTWYSPGKAFNGTYRLLDVRTAAAENYKSDFYKAWGGINYDNGRGIDLDGSGNIYITGKTESFGDIDGDAFIAKFNSSGNSVKHIIWGGINNDDGQDIALDGTGNIYITGKTESFGDIDGDAFIAKFDSSRNSVMNITWGGSNYDEGQYIILDGSGNIYITGRTDSFGPGNEDAFIAKFNSSGSLQWDEYWGGSEQDEGNNIALDGSGNIYITGLTTSFGDIDGDAFIAKFNSSGDSAMNITWGGNSGDYGYGIALDGSGNIYITGGTYSFGAGTEDAFIAKYDSSGVLQWDITWGGIDYDRGENIALDGSGSIYITGNTYSFSTGTSDAFLAKYNSNGNLEEVILWGGRSFDKGYDIVLDSSGNIYITGTTNSFGVGDYDAFIVKNPSNTIGRDDTTQEEAIPSYDLFLLIGLFGILSILVAKKHLKILKT